MWAKVKHEAAHYWHGSKLLVSEMRISLRLVFALLQGKTLTRREKRQLRRTTTDLLRLIPFSVFVIVPFMELLLPVAIKLFPNMLPSTFEDKFAAEEKQRKLLRVRLEMAKFLQETLRESGLKGDAKIMASEEFKEFFRKVRSTGEAPSSEDILKVAKLFSDDFTLDNLSRPQLTSICRYLGLNAFGTDNFLKGTIRRRLDYIKQDDQLIGTEGVDSLSTSELIQASQSRALRTVGISPARLREQMNTWIQLHYKEGVSGVLLILSRAYGLDRDLGGKGTSPDAEIWRSLEAVLSGLPENLLNEAELAVESDAASYQKKLEVIKEQEELIEDEKEQELKEEDARRRKRQAEEKAKREEEARLAESLLPDSELHPTPEVEEMEKIKDARMTVEQLRELGEALLIVSARSSCMKERKELRALMDENLSTGEDPKAPQNPLAKKIRNMLTKIDKQLSAYDEKVGSSLQLIQMDPHGRISLKDLEQALSVIAHAPPPEVVQAIVKKLDVDDDGYVMLEHVLDLIGEEGLGVVVDADAQDLLGQGREILSSKTAKPKKEDIIQE
ncbi:LETM1-domain-containing protein [Serendipita vermifera]|nr:LETM1-domain-containing protein [Serendipita vermifera]